MTRILTTLSLAFTTIGLGVIGSAQAFADGYPDNPVSVRWPGEGGKKVEIKMGIYLIDFARVNIREESFDMAGYLDTTWTDPNLVKKPGDKMSGVRRFRPGQIWAPELEFVNAVEQVKAEREGDLYVQDDGQVTQRIRFSHKFQSDLDLRRFPFDHQSLTIVVAPFDFIAHDLVLSLEPSRVGRLEEASVTDWSIDGINARIEQRKDGDGRFLFEVKISRESNFYIWRVLLPMTLLVVASWSVFLFEPTNLQPQISTGLAILLSLTTFIYAIDFSLPKVEYLTFIDRYTLTSFAFVLSVTFAVTAIHVVQRGTGGLASALKIQKNARWLFPCAYIVTIALMAILSLQ